MPIAVKNLHDPAFANIQVHSRSSLYQSELAAAGYPLASYNLSELVRAVVLEESVSEAARRFEVVLDNGDPAALTPVTVGSDIHFYAPTVDTNGLITAQQRLFYGRAFSDSRSSSAGDQVRTFVCYDICTFLARTEDILVFDGLTATEILRQIATLYHLPLGRVAGTGVKVGQIVMGPNVTLWAALNEALVRTYRKSGRRFFIRASEYPAKLELLELGKTGITWYVRDGEDGILVSASYEESAEEIRTKLRLVQEEIDEEEETSRQVVIAERLGDKKYRDTFGVLTRISPPDNSDQTEAETAAQANFEIKNLARTRQRLVTESLLLPGVRRGDSVVVTTGALGVNNYRSDGGVAWYVDAVSQSYTPQILSMTLELVRDLSDAGGGA